MRIYERYDDILNFLTTIPAVPHVRAMWIQDLRLLHVHLDGIADISYGLCVYRDYIKWRVVVHTTPRMRVEEADLRDLLNKLLGRDGLNDMMRARVLSMQFALNVFQDLDPAE